MNYNFQTKTDTHVSQILLWIFFTPNKFSDDIRCQVQHALKLMEYIKGIITENNPA